MKNTNIICLAILISTLLPLQAWSQTTELYVENFEPESTQKTAILNVARSEVLPSGIPSVGLFVHFVDDAVQLRREGSEEAFRLLDDQLKAEIAFGMGMFGFLDFGAVLPITVFQTGDSLKEYNNNADSVPSFSFADARMNLKARILPKDSSFGLAVSLTAYIPLGNRAFHSDGDFRFEPKLIADWTGSDLKAALNLGYQIRSERNLRNVGSGDILRMGAGLQYQIASPVSLYSTITAGLSLADGRDPNNLTTVSDNTFGSPVEVDGGVKLELIGDWTINLGGGIGVSQGIGAPDFRIFGGVEHVAFPQGANERAMLAEAEQSSKNPEERDSDQDGIMDALDKCPNQSEDIDTFEDEDGCPDPDNDKDGVLDIEDECPGLSGIPEKQGCPLIDSDKDGIDDDSDACPMEPEDRDSFEDDDGCPDLDNDLDGILDTDDKCPLKPETINGKDDEDGCPDSSESKVRITKTGIEIFEMVYFDTNKSVIQKRSYNILNQVKSILRANPRIKLIQVEGHTDNRGSAKANLELSQRRAEAVVKYLVEKGIEAQRFRPKGFGEARPVADNKSKAGRTENRRVEFFILDMTSK